MKFLNFSLILMDGSNKRITTEYKAEDTEIFKQILEKIFQKYNLALKFDHLIIKDVESMNIDPAFWDQKVIEITQLYGILFVIEIYPSAVKQLSEEEEKDEEMKADAEQKEEGFRADSSKEQAPQAEIAIPNRNSQSFQNGGSLRRGSPPVSLSGPPALPAPPAPPGGPALPAPPAPAYPSITSSLPGDQAPASLSAPPTSQSSAPPNSISSPSAPKKRMSESQTTKKSLDAEEKSSRERSKNDLSDSIYNRRQTGPQEYDKNLAVEYYDRMNPEQNYILKLNISDLKLTDVDTRENLLTGERITQKKDKLKIILEDPNVLVRPLFPGCLVTPTEQWTNFDVVEDELIFHITPLVKAEINGTIDFISKNKIVYRMPLPAKVDDPRYAKTVVAYGTGISLLPKILPWFGFDVGESLELADIMPFLGGLMGSMAVNNFIAILGIILFLIAGIVVFIKKQAKFTKKQFSLTDIANYQKITNREKQL